MSDSGKVGEVFVNVEPEFTVTVLARLRTKAEDLRDNSASESRRDTAELFIQWIRQEVARIEGGK